MQTLDRLWDDQLAVIVPKMELINKSDALGMFRTGRMKFLRYETTDPDTHLWRDRDRNRTPAADAENQ